MFSFFLQEPVPKQGRAPFLVQQGKRFKPSREANEAISRAYQRALNLERH